MKSTPLATILTILMGKMKTIFLPATLLDLTKRKPDLRARDHLPLSYAVFEGVLPAQVVRFLANRLRRR